MGSFYVEMIYWQRSQRVKIWIPNLSEYKIYSWKYVYHGYYNQKTFIESKAIYRINAVINYIIVS